MASAPLPIADPVASAMEWVRARIDASRAPALRGSFAFAIEGPRGGVFTVRIDAGRARFDRAACAEADVRIRAGVDAWDDLLAGRESPELLSLAGRLEVEGDLALAVKLRCLFRARPEVSARA